MSCTMFTIHWATDITEGYMSARGLASIGRATGLLRRGIAFRIGQTMPAGHIVWGNWHVA